MRAELSTCMRESCVSLTCFDAPGNPGRSTSFGIDFLIYVSSILFPIQKPLRPPITNQLSWISRAVKVCLILHRSHPELTMLLSPGSEVLQILFTLEMLQEDSESLVLLENIPFFKLRESRT